MNKQVIIGGRRIGKTYSAKVELYIKAQEAYQLGSPIMTDEEFDILEQEVAPSIGVPGEYELPMRMWSIGKDNTNKLEKKYTCIVQYKIDGVALLLYYRSGKFVDAFTRGDGVKGQCVTHHAKYMSFPKIIQSFERGSEYCIIGEAYIEKHVAEVLGYKNARNGVAGMLNNKDVQPENDKHIKLFVFSLINLAEEPSWNTEVLELQHLKRFGFQIPPTFTTTAKAHMQLQRASLPYLIDGLVIKVNNQETQQKLGYTDHHPRFISAYKFAATANSTTVQKIEWQVGRTGLLVPVAHLVPVTLNGSTISKATLHSYSRVKEMGVAPNDTVTIKKAGDIIPYVAEVVEKGEYSFDPLIVDCPSCQKAIHMEGAHAKCFNYFCIDQRWQAFHYACKTIGVKGIGVKNAQDIIMGTSDFSLRRSFERARNGQFTFPKSVPMWKAIQMLGEPGLGRAASKKAADSGNTIYDYLTKDDADALVALLNIEQ